MNVMETASVVTPNGEPLWSVETVGAALKDARDRGLVILGGDVFDEKMRETGENWCYQPVWTPSYSEFSKTSSENSFRRAAEYVIVLGAKVRGSELSNSLAGSAGCDGSLHLCGRTVKGEAA